MNGGGGNEKGRVNFLYNYTMQKQEVKVDVTIKYLNRGNCYYICSFISVFIQFSGSGYFLMHSVF